MSELVNLNERRGKKGDRRHNDTSPIGHAQIPGLILTFRENQVLLALSQGHTDYVIAEQLSLSQKTVQHHIRRISFKLETQNRTQTVVKAIKLGLIKL